MIGSQEGVGVCPFAKVIHIDIDPTSIRKTFMSISRSWVIARRAAELNQILRATVSSNQKIFASLVGPNPVNGSRRIRWPINKPDGAIKPQHVVKQFV